MVLFIVMPMKVESDGVGDAVAHSFCSHARKKNGTRFRCLGSELPEDSFSRSLNHGGGLRVIETQLHYFVIFSRYFIIKFRIFVSS